MDIYRELKIRCDPGFGHLQTAIIIMVLAFIKKATLITIIVRLAHTFQKFDYIIRVKKTYQ